MKRGVLNLDSTSVEVLKKLYTEGTSPLSSKLSATSKSKNHSIQLSIEEVEILLDILPPPLIDADADHTRKLLTDFAHKLHQLT